MSNRQKNSRKTEEIIGELAKSKLKKHKYVFVEGVDDVKIYREIVQTKHDRTKFTFEETGGRDPLFKLNNAIRLNPLLVNKTMLFADKDTFVFNSTPIPSEHENIQFTKGYSIENDLFEDGYDFFMSYLSQTEKKRFELLVNNISDWYAFEIEKILAGDNADSKIAINGLNEKIIAPRSEQLQAEFLIKRGYAQAEEELCQLIKNDFKSLLRGKILFEVLLRISFDRIDSFHYKEVPAFWNISIIEGLRIPESNCNRIIRTFESSLNEK